MTQASSGSEDGHGGAAGRTDPNRWVLRTISQLSPASKKWLEEKGYISITTSDGDIVIKVTQAGYKYFGGLLPTSDRRR